VQQRGCAWLAFGDTLLTDRRTNERYIPARNIHRTFACGRKASETAMHTQLPASPDASHNTTCSPVPPNQNNMHNENYMAFVALDWGDKKHAFARQDTGVERIEQGSIDATPEALHAWLEQLGKTYEGKPVALAVEAGRNSLLHALLEYPWLTIYPVHPATSARFRTAFTPSGAKDDGPDAVVILTLLRTHRAKLTPLILDTAQTRELAALVAARRSAVDHRTSTACQLGSVLKGYFPQALTLAGDDLTKPMALAFLRRSPELAAVKKASPKRSRSVCYATSWRNLPTSRLHGHLSAAATARFSTLT
jgi:hypothetical protein